ncbi:hypothetical protein SNE40_002822 [Patella caerulea]|uniref:DDE Tnp4 domain-containing protein n=1 Tax=Patella caerulea TaxID=87958 RepID=A0AAN8Q088_PATCE
MLFRLQILYHTEGSCWCRPKGIYCVCIHVIFWINLRQRNNPQKWGFLKSLLQSGKLQEVDGVMADKRFTIEKEINNVRLCLNIPPFVPSSASQMSAPAVAQTIKIAKHRVHVERAICRVKQFKLLTNKVSLSSFSCVNQIWLVCCVLTNFMSIFDPLGLSDCCGKVVDDG